MRILVTGKIFRLRVFLLFGILLVPILSMAQSSQTFYYVRAGATGNGSGTDWTNAYTDLPATLVRGATYYVAAGTYGPWVLNTADSGTTLITIKAATAASHGAAPDWSSSYAGLISVSEGCPTGYGCGNVFFATDYWVLDGQSRTGWTTGYNIYIDEPGPGTNHNALYVGNPYANGGGTTASHVTVSYVEMKGSACPTCAAYDSGAVLQSGDSNVTFSHDYIHDVGLVNIKAAGGSNLIIDHCFLSNNKQSTTTAHAEGITFMGSNLTVSNSIMLNMDATSFISDAGGGTAALSNWDIYGNVFYWDNCAANGRTFCTIGNGIVTWLTGTTFTGTMRIVNNTVANIQPTNGSTCNGSLFISDVGLLGTIIIENNVLSNVCNTTESSGGAQTYDYNSYYGGTNDPNDTSSHKQVIKGAPFVNGSAGDFHLAADMTGSQVGISFPAPYNVDPDKQPRGGDGTWDRGAYEFLGNVAKPTPPASLTVTGIS